MQACVILVRSDLLRIRMIGEIHIKCTPHDLFHRACFFHGPLIIDELPLSVVDQDI